MPSIWVPIVMKRNHVLIALGILTPLLLTGGCPLATNTNTNTNSNSSSLVGDAVAGQTVYVERCASCHSLGSFDASGSAGNLHGRAGSIIANLASYSSAMRGITLTAQEVADIKAFVQAN